MSVVSFVEDKIEVEPNSFDCMIGNLGGGYFLDFKENIFQSERNEGPI